MGGYRELHEEQRGHTQEGDEATETCVH
jgi:hypothetical protein